MNQTSRTTVLNQMINLRRLPAFKPETSQTKPYREAWKQKDGSSPEDRILEIAELAYILAEDGFPAPKIFERIGGVHGPAPVPIRSSWHDHLDCYISHHLKQHDEGYVNLGANLFHATLELARLWAQLNAQRVASSCWPPPDMFGRKEKKGLQALDRFTDGEIGRDVRRFKVRAIPGDKLLHYATDDVSWIAQMGSMGFALVRDGKSIDSIETIMN